MKLKIIKKLVRPNILSIQPYQSARRLNSKGIIWLNANEYPENINFDIKTNNLNRYPNFQPQEVIKLYALYSGLKENQILVHRGADEGIELLMRTFCEPKKDHIMFFPPTYGMYKVIAETIGLKYLAIEKKSNWQLNLCEISKYIKDVKIMFICHPNNPTANTINLKDLSNLISIVNNKAIIVIDEAYIEFCYKFTLLKWLKNNINLVILRTMSKAFALAGIRCGFTLAHEYIINLLLKVIAPYPLPSPVIDIATQALSVNGINKMKENIKKIIITKNWFINALSNCTCVNKIFFSSTNYVLVNFKKSEKILIFLKEKGIILRNQNMHIQLKNCLRITIGSLEECKSVISILKKL